MPGQHLINGRRLNDEAPVAHLNNGSRDVKAEDVFVFPTTVAQQGFWFLDQVEPGNPAYNIAIRVGLQGALNHAVMERALNKIVARHESLRTTFANVEGEPVQVVAGELAIPLPMEDLRSVQVAQRQARAEQLAVEEARGHFDLATGPLIRAKLLRLDDEEHVLLLTVHHIVSDGWSLGIIVDELSAQYDDLCCDRRSALPDLPLQYADFAVWQQQWLATADLKGQLAYWSQRLANLPLLEVPMDRPRRLDSVTEGRIESLLLPKSLTDTLTEVSHRQQATFFMLALAALKILLQRATGKNDVHVGSVVAGRSRVELEPIIGPFINALVFRTDLTGNPRFPELLARVRDTVLQGLANQDVPFERVVQELRPQRDLGRHPLFQINFIFQRGFVRPHHCADLTMSPIPSVSPGAIFDLNFAMVERADGWRASCEYNAQLYDAATIMRLLSEFHGLLADIAADPARHIDDLGRSRTPHGDGQPTAGVPAHSIVPLHRGGDGRQIYVAPRDEIETTLALMWEQLLGIRQISVSTDFFAVGGNSLLAAKLLAQVGRTFGRKLSLTSLFQAPTVEALAAKLRDERGKAASQQIYPIQPQGTQVPLILQTSQPHIWRPLALRLGTNQPLFGLTLPELTALPKRFAVSDIAANLISALRTMQPHGPYYLGAWCQSGVVVYEMAQQLRAAGEDVALLALFDTTCPPYARRVRRMRGYWRRFFVSRVAYHMEKVRRLPFRDAVGYAFRVIASVARRRWRYLENFLWPRGEQAVTDELRNAIETQLRTVDDYAPQPYDGPMVLIRSEATKSTLSPDHHLGWREYARGKLDVHVVGPDHGDMFLEPFVGSLAEELAKLLDRQARQ